MSLKEVQLACFKVGDEVYGADITSIKEIILYKKATAVPSAPEFMEGILNLRGKVIPIVDLRKRLGVPLPKGGVSRSTRIIIIHVAKKDVGVIVDSVDKVIKATSGKGGTIDPSPNISSEVGTKFLSGVAREGEEMIMILDMEKVLSSRDKVELGNIKNVVPEEAAEEDDRS